MPPSTFLRPLLLLCAIAPFAACMVPRGDAIRDLDRLIECNDEAVGGPSLRRVSEVQYVIDIEEPTFSVVGRYRATRDGTAAIDVFAGDERVFSEGWNGTAGWQLHAGAVDTLPVSPDAAAPLRHGVEQPGHLRTLADMIPDGHRLELVAPNEEEPSRGTVDLHLVLSDGFESWYTVDTGTCMVRASRNFRAFHPDVDPEATWIETRYSEPVTSDGITRHRRSVNVDLVTGDTLGVTTIREVVHLFADAGG